LVPNLSLSLVIRKFPLIFLQWKQILSEFRLQQQHPTTLWCDNQSVIQLAKDLAQHQYIKHIERALQQEVSLVLCPQISLLLNI
jgi:hypothetical protein